MLEHVQKYETARFNEIEAYRLRLAHVDVWRFTAECTENTICTLYVPCRQETGIVHTGRFVNNL